jgi:hypothetical protein
MSFFRATYAKAGGIAFLGELGAHILVLTTSFLLVDLPFWADWFFFILGGYSTIGFIVFRDALIWRCGDKFFTQFTVLWMGASVLLHGYIIFIAHSHEILRIFSRNYSFIGVLYCFVFGLHLITQKTRSD